MRAVARLTSPIAATLIAAGCGGKQYDPWILPREQFSATVHTIALVSTEMPENLDDPDPAQALFDSLLEATLQAAGIPVVNTAVTGDIWNRLVDSVGGYYDPFTGHRDSIRFEAVQRSWQQILRDTHRVDATLFPRMVVVDARVTDWKATWDGASQTVEPWGRALMQALDIVAAAFAGSDPVMSHEGTTPALSLVVQIERLDGEVMYENRGGIEVWAKPHGPVPRAAMFRDMERNLKAVRLALGSILAGHEVAQSR